MEVGKISNKDLEEIIFDKIKNPRVEVIQKSGLGIDAGILNFAGDDFVISTDPITGASKGLGRLAVNVSANDIATEGADPVALLLTILMPPKSDLKEFEEIIDEALAECEKLGMDLIGGHSEVTDAVTKPLVSSTVIGRKKALKLQQPKPGDYLAMTKEAGIEGALILLLEDKENLEKILTPEEINHIEGFKDKLSVVKEGKLARMYGASLLHDVTEGGVFGGIWELATRSGFGVYVDREKIPVHSGLEKICKEYSISPYNLISSGSMLILIGAENYTTLKGKLAECGIELEKIGVLKKEKSIIDLEGNNIEMPLADHLYKALALIKDKK